MKPTLAIGAVPTEYGDLQIAAVVGDHAGLAALADARNAHGEVPTSAPVVVASGWIDLEVLLARVDETIRHLPRTSTLPADVVAAVEQWSAGAADALDDVAVAQAGGEFRQAAWTALRQVRGGTVVTYSELAALAGNPKASRAAGSACATNLVAPFVPCHRVVQSGGSVGNYAYGPDLKTSMLVREGALLTLT